MVVKTKRRGFLALLGALGLGGCYRARTPNTIGGVGGGGPARLPYPDDALYIESGEEHTIAADSSEMYDGLIVEDEGKLTTEPGGALIMQTIN